MTAKHRVKVPVVGLLLLILASCATIPELNINYSLPKGSDQLKDREIFLGFADDRSSKEIFGEGAKEEFKGFPGNFSLSVSEHGEEGFKIGLYDMKSLFLEAFKLKLEKQGMRVYLDAGGKRPELIIVLKEFSLDLEKRKWILNMGYEAELLVDGRVRARQMINGKGDRLRLIRHDQADILAGEVFTDIVNKLDVAKMFRQAGIDAG